MIHHFRTRRFAMISYCPATICASVMPSAYECRKEFFGFASTVLIILDALPYRAVSCHSTKKLPSVDNNSLVV